LAGSRISFYKENDLAMRNLRTFSQEFKLQVVEELMSDESGIQDQYTSKRLTRYKNGIKLFTDTLKPKITDIINQLNDSAVGYRIGI
jgi:hypothetical protein